MDRDTKRLLRAARENWASAELRYGSTKVARLATIGWIKQIYNKQAEAEPRVARVIMTFEELQEKVRKLNDLCRDPHPGLMTWHLMVATLIKQIYNDGMMPSFANTKG